MSLVQNEQNRDEANSDFCPTASLYKRAEGFQNKKKEKRIYHASLSMIALFDR